MKPLISNRQLNIGVAVIATLLLLIFLLSFSDTGAPPTFNQVPEQSRSPEFYLVDTSTDHYDEQGQRVSTTSSETVTHISNTDTARLHKPSYISLQANQPQWITTASSGVLHLNGEQLDLSQQVMAVNPDKKTQLKTPALTIYPNRKFAENDQSVTITSQQGFTRGKGLQVDLTKGEMTLLNKVRGQYHAVSD